MAYSVERAWIMLDRSPEYTSDSWIKTSTKEYFAGIGNEIKIIFDQEPALPIDASEDFFGEKIRPIVEAPIKKLVAELIKDPEFIQNKTKIFIKLFIRLLNDSDNSQQNYFIIEKNGWKQTDLSNQATAISKRVDEILLLSKEKGFARADNPDAAAKKIKAIGKLLGIDVDPELAKDIAGAGQAISGTAAELKAKAEKLMQATIEFDNGKEVGDNTKAFQRCLIRFAGGNLVAERNHLREPNYILNPNAKGYADFAAKMGPVVGKMRSNPKKNYADDGRFGPETLDAARKLLPIINQILGSDKVDDPKVFPASILSSKVCAGLVGKDPIGSEQEDYEKMKEGTYQPPAASASSSAASGSTTGSGGAATTGTSSASTTVVPTTKIDLNQIKASKEYQAVKQAESDADMIASMKIRPKFEELNKKLELFASKYNNGSMSKANLLTELGQAKKEAEDTATLNNASAENFKTAVIAFLNFLEKSMSTLQEVKRNYQKVIKETKKSIYTEYSFLSNKNSKLHSVLMEQLKKDLKRG